MPPRAAPVPRLRPQTKSVFDPGPPKAQLRATAGSAIVPSSAPRERSRRSRAAPATGEVTAGGRRSCRPES